MKKCIILALSLFLSCQETIQPEYSQCFSMTFSDAQPVQFWLADCATYNEKEVCGVYASCFCQPFECDDEIKIQFTDSGSQSYILQFVDEDENLIDELNFDSAGEVYSKSFIPSETSPDMCDTKIQLRIAQLNITQEWEFDYSIEGWVNDGSVGSDWAWDSGLGGSVKVSITGDRSERLVKNGFSLPTANYRIYVYFYFNAGEGASVLIRARDAALSTLVSGTVISGVNEAGYYEGYLDVDDSLIVDFENIAIQVFDDNLGIVPNVYLLGVELINLDAEKTIVAKSDCLDIRSEHECSELITYSNHRNFAGLNFEASSPDESFYLRVPCVFFHERFPEEQEVMDLSDSQMIVLNGTLKVQKLMETDYMPYYMHRKLKLVLMFQSLEIGGQNWVKAESYEIQDGNKRYPKKQAKVWLNEADYVQRNVL